MLIFSESINDFYDNELFTLNKKYLSLIGLWPSQSVRSQLVIRNAILMEFFTIFVAEVNKEVYICNCHSEAERKDDFSSSSAYFILGEMSCQIPTTVEILGIKETTINCIYSFFTMVYVFDGP